MSPARNKTGIGDERTQPSFENFIPKELRPSGTGVPVGIPRPRGGGEQREIGIISSTLRALFLGFGGLDGLHEYKQSEAFEKNAAALGLTPDNLERIVIEEISGIERPPSESDIAKPPIA